MKKKLKDVTIMEKGIHCMKTPDCTVCPFNWLCSCNGSLLNNKGLVSDKINQEVEIKL